MTWRKLRAGIAAVFNNGRHWAAPDFLFAIQGPGVVSPQNKTTRLSRYGVARRVVRVAPDPTLGAHGERPGATPNRERRST